MSYHRTYDVICNSVIYMDIHGCGKCVTVSQMDGEYYCGTGFGVYLCVCVGGLVLLVSLLVVY
jgi:hypothetical protein